MASSSDVLAHEYELIDPTPDIWMLFQDYNAMFFYGKLAGCEVRWSNRMTSCAGLCSYQPASGFCSIRLSEPLLKLRPRSDLINTLLHEMIHAYIFLTSPFRDHDDHGPIFQSHMRRINAAASSNITVYHTFRDEVRSYQKHWWKCTGPCQHRKPFFGIVRRAMNRTPGPNDRWWAEHQMTCGGVFEKIREPEGFSAKKRKSEPKSQRNKKKKDGIDAFFVRQPPKSIVIDLCSSSEDDKC